MTTTVNMRVNLQRNSTIKSPVWTAARFHWVFGFQVLAPRSAELGLKSALDAIESTASDCKFPPRGHNGIPQAQRTSPCRSGTARRIAFHQADDRINMEQ